MIRDLLVCGQGDAEEMPGRPDWVVVSIRDPGKPPAALSPHWGAVLQLAFHDKDDEVLAEQTGLWQLFSEQQAHQCLDFVRKHQSTARGLLVHCFAGASRSPAVARALAHMLEVPCGADWAKGNPLVAERMRVAAARSR